MDPLDVYRSTLIEILNGYASLFEVDGQVRSEVICDRQQDHYLLMQVGWDARDRVHGVLIHVDLIQGKLWIQHDGTERGIAEDLVTAGVPKDRIVLAFRPPQARKYTEFAAA